MPLYDITCAACRFSGECYAKVAELDQSGRILCPECGERADQNYATKRVGVGNPAFVGDRARSRTEGWHPSEVAEVRKILPERSAACVRDNGKVYFRDREEQRRYVRDVEAVRAKFREQKGLPPEKFEPYKKPPKAKKRPKGRAPRIVLG
jgi:hypothetical protein